MIIAGGKLLIDKINNSGNKLVPLDSEHFSMVNSNLIIKKLIKFI